MAPYDCQFLPADAAKELPAAAAKEEEEVEEEVEEECEQLRHQAPMLRREPEPEAESPAGSRRHHLREPESEPEDPSRPSSPRRPRKEVVTIFDWDDTLLCSSYLKAHCKDEEAPDEVLPVLRSIEASARRLLELAAGSGRCVIVTNAVEGWVEYSAEKYLPGVRAMLDDVRIISARSIYSETMPGQANNWKVQAFRDVCRELGSEEHLHLTAVGDSDLEMHAAQAVSRELEHVVLKTVKLQELPSPEDLAKELTVVSQKFPKILSAPRDLSISLARKWAGGATA